MNAFFSVPSACERRDPSCTPPYPSRSIMPPLSMSSPWTWPQNTGVVSSAPCRCAQVFSLILIVIRAAAAVVVVVVVVVVAVVAVFLLSLFRYCCCVSLRASAA